MDLLKEQGSSTGCEISSTSLQLSSKLQQNGLIQWGNNNNKEDCPSMDCSNSNEERGEISPYESATSELNSTTEDGNSLCADLTIPLTINIGDDIDNSNESKASKYSLQNISANEVLMAPGSNLAAQMPIPGSASQTMEIFTPLHQLAIASANFSIPSSNTSPVFRNGMNTTLSSVINPNLAINSNTSHFNISPTSFNTMNLNIAGSKSDGNKDGDCVTSPYAMKVRTTPAREAVDPAKYYTLTDEPDGTKYACSKCGNVYKWRKSLNKHWKEKHDGEVPESRNQARMNSVRDNKQPRQNVPVSSQVKVGGNKGRTGYTLSCGPVSSSAGMQINYKSQVKYPTAQFNIPPRTDYNLTSILNVEENKVGQSVLLPHLQNTQLMSSLSQSIQRSSVLGSWQTEGTAKKFTGVPFQNLNNFAHNFSGSGVNYLSVPDNVPLDMTKSPLEMLSSYTKELSEGVLDLSTKGSAVSSSSDQSGSEIDINQEEPIDFSVKPCNSQPVLHSTCSRSVTSSYSSIQNFLSKNTVPAMSHIGQVGGTVTCRVGEAMIGQVGGAGTGQVGEAMTGQVGGAMTGQVGGVSNQTGLVGGVMNQTGQKGGAVRCNVCCAVFSCVMDLNNHFSERHSDLFWTFAASSLDANNSSDPSSASSPIGGSGSSPQLFRYLTMDSSERQPQSHLSCIVCGSSHQWMWMLAKHFDQQHHSVANGRNPYRTPSLNEQQNSGSFVGSSVGKDLISVPSAHLTTERTHILHSQSLRAAHSSYDRTESCSRGQIENKTGEIKNCQPARTVSIRNDSLQSEQLSKFERFDGNGNSNGEFKFIQRGNNGLEDTEINSKVFTTSMFDILPDGSGELIPSDTAIVIPQAPEDDSSTPLSATTSHHPSSPSLTPFSSVYQVSSSSSSGRGSLGEASRCELDGKEGSSPEGEDNGMTVLPYACELCEYRARWPSEMTQHMKNHSDEKPYKCSRCSYRSKWKWDVVKHLKRCVPTNGAASEASVLVEPSSYSLPSSPNFSTKNLQRKRKKTHKSVLLSGSSLSTTNSPLGEMSYLQPGEMEHDGKESQGNRSEGSASPVTQMSSVSASSGQLLHYCAQCPFIGHSPAELKRHLRVHSDEKPYSCGSCNYSSKWKCDLKKHLRAYNHIPAIPLLFGNLEGRPESSNESQMKSADWINFNESEDCMIKKNEIFNNENSYHSDRASYDENSMNEVTKCKESFKHQGELISGGCVRCKNCGLEAVDITSYNAQIKCTPCKKIKLNEKSGKKFFNGTDLSNKKFTKLENATEVILSSSTGPDLKVELTDEANCKSHEEEISQNLFWASLQLQANKDALNEEQVVKSPIDSPMNFSSQSEGKPLKPVSAVSVAGINRENIYSYPESNMQHGEGIMSSTKSNTSSGSNTIGCGLYSDLNKNGNINGSSNSDNSAHGILDFNANNNSNFNGNGITDLSANGNNDHATNATEWITEENCALVSHPDSDNNNWTETATDLSKPKTLTLSSISQNVTLNSNVMQQANRGFSAPQLEGLNLAMPFTVAPTDKAFSINNTLRKEEMCEVRNRWPQFEGRSRHRVTTTEAEDAAGMSKRKRKLRACAKCGYVTDNLTTLQRHAAKHGSGGRHKCVKCDYSVDRQHILDYHVRIVHELPTTFVGCPQRILALPIPEKKLCSKLSVDSKNESRTDVCVLIEDLKDKSYNKINAISLLKSNSYEPLKLSIKTNLLEPSRISNTHSNVTEMDLANVESQIDDLNVVNCDMDERIRMARISNSLKSNVKKFSMNGNSKINTFADQKKKYQLFSRMRTNRKMCAICGFSTLNAAKMIRHRLQHSSTLSINMSRRRKLRPLLQSHIIQNACQCLSLNGEENEVNSPSDSVFKRSSIVYNSEQSYEDYTGISNPNINSESSLAIDRSYSKKENLSEDSEELLQAENQGDVSHSLVDLRHCPSCPFKCPSVSQLVQHARCHGARRKYTCSVCDFSSNLYGSFSSHQLLHKQ